MGSIIIALPKLEDAKRISDILKRRGLEVAALCTSASGVLSKIHQLDSGIVICSSRLSDMHYTQLAEYLPEFFEILLVASPAVLETCPSGIMTLTMPFKPGDLLGTAEMMLIQQARRIKKRKGPKKRTAEEQRYIDDAKKVLMERNNMTEQEAFRYIQKCSMDSGTNMVESAQMILMMMCEEQQT